MAGIVGTNKALHRRDMMKLLAASGAAVSAPGSRAQAAAPSSIVVVADQQPTSLDPITGTNGGDFKYLYPVYDTLVDWDGATLQPRPRLATDWSFTTPTSFVMNLRANVLFHDGTPFDAEAVRFNLDRIRTDAHSNFKFDLASVSKIEVTGPLQITLTLNRPNAALPLVLSERAGLMASPAAVAKSGADFARNPVGTGPYLLTQWTDGDTVAYARDPKHWDPDHQHLDEIRFKIITDVSTGLRSVLAGENDMVNSVAPSQKAVVERSTKVKTDISNSQAIYPVWINNARPPFNDVRVRQALLYAIDRNAFNKVTAAGLAEGAGGRLPKAHWAYDPATEHDYPYDLDKAKALLAAAGQAAGFEMTLMGPNDDRSRARQEFVAAQLAKVGIRVTIKGMSVNDSIKAFFVDKSADAILVLFGGRPDPSQTFRDLFGKQAFLNAGHWEPEGFNEALVASEATSDLAVRKQALAKVQRIVAENALMVPLIFDPQFTVMSKRVEGFTPNLFGRLRFDTISVTG